MRILITGGTGFVGRRLCERLAEAGHALLVVSRDPAKAQRVLPAGTDIESSVLAFTDRAPEAIVNLAGEAIAERRWSNEQKRRLIDSRVAITRDLVMLCQHLENTPAVMISGSAMGYYGDQGDREVTEDTPPHDEFAHRLCESWEQAAREAEAFGVRVALVRIGLVLERGGGTLARMLPPFKLGLGGRFGSGRQFMPWVHREDLVRIIEFLLERDALQGPFNGSAPHPVTNTEFARTLARHLRRPALLPVPALALKLGFGEMSRLLLTGADMRPARLQAAGFEFRYPTLDEALTAILKQ
ncbi:epimerase [Litchfieldella qijiaojingensis]|uniref:Epimerase n=1 Tax=Litchfieldella qijiaojingensis TaxID=980347 RepID=A0ABQ2Z3A5_9GAMM|nr:TIGR01777 family oxidoreductase [Halomonas qijiaojingensis]GGY03563.1 epimerase [Halomonas qijiaojingensis]